MIQTVDVSQNMALKAKMIEKITNKFFGYKKDVVDSSINNLANKSILRDLNQNYQNLHLQISKPKKIIQQLPHKRYQTLMPNLEDLNVIDVDKLVIIQMSALRENL